jgi:hypothetical protein
MSKKAKHTARKSQSTTKTSASGSVGSTPAPVLETSRSTFRSEREFNPDYSYVIKDLKRIGALAGIFIALLIALSFII